MLGNFKVLNLSSTYFFVHERVGLKGAYLRTGGIFKNEGLFKKGVIQEGGLRILL